MSGQRVALAFSGGGFRATAFGLGCLRALHDAGVLPKVRVVSGISGGSLLAALWTYGPSDFIEFDALVTDMLHDGLQMDVARHTLAPHHVAANAFAAIARRGTGFNRTDALRLTLERRAFGDRLVSDPNRPDISTVISATDLVTSRAVRFGSVASACSPYGRIIEPITVAEAVAASAAYPLLLPPLRRVYTFERGEDRRRARVVMTDGGVYDNLGLSVVEPGRSPAHTDHVYEVDYIIACDAGRQEKGESNAHLLPLRLRRSFDITYRKAQDAGRNRLHLARAAGQLRGFVHAYLGMRDRNLPVPVPDLIRLEQVNDYPTNFAAMRDADITTIAGRAEQLTRALLAYYCPEL